MREKDLATGECIKMFQDGNICRRLSWDALLNREKWLCSWIGQVSAGLKFSTRQDSQTGRAGVLCPRTSYTSVQVTMNFDPVMQCRKSCHAV